MHKKIPKKDLKLVKEFLKRVIEGRGLIFISYIDEEKKGLESIVSQNIGKKATIELLLNKANKLAKKELELESEKYMKKMAG